MRRLLATTLLLAGCTSSIYGGEPPVGCETEDADGDGFLSEACLGAGNPLADCNDADAQVFPDAPELCNGRDDDCDRGIDEGLSGTPLFADCDGDTYGGAVGTAESCDVALLPGPDCGEATGTWVPIGGDCDDSEIDVFPGEAELCNDRDDDCDGFVDEDVAETAYFADCDGDGLGGDEETAAICDVDLLEAPACGGTPGVWVDEGGDCDDFDATRQSSCGACGSVDLLFVVDNTAGLVPAQQRLSAVLPSVIEPLATGDLDGDGAIDTEPIADLQIGAVTTDMGSRGYTYTSCREPNFGDDGLLITEPEACAMSVPTYSSLDPMGDVAGFVSAAQCHVSMGGNGCLYEQPLEAGLRALTPAASPRRFHPVPMGLGHGDLANSGFLRDDSVLLVTVLTDEDDCSVAPGGETLYDPSGGNDYGPQTRCAFAGPDLNFIERYTSGFLALRDAEDLVFGLVGGIPSDIVIERPAVGDYDAILSDSRMVPTMSPTGGDRLVASCTTPEMTDATPPRRLVQLGRQLTERGARTVLGSVCDPTLDAMAQALVAAALEARDRRCGG